MKVNVGDSVYIPDEDETYTVRARDDNFIICTRPYEDTVAYFIIDLEEKRRGPDNIVFGSGYETDEQCEDRLKELQTDEIEISMRYGINLDIEIS